MWARKMTRSMGLVAFLALAACGTDYSGDDDGDPNPDPGPGDGCQSLTELECRQAPDCSPVFAPGAGFVECGDNEVIPEGCNADSDCPENYYCGFTRSEEAPGNVCFCPDCVEGDGCPPCDCGIEDPIEPPSEGQCLPAPVETCFDDSDCDRGERCDFSQDPNTDNRIDDAEEDAPCACPPCEPGEECGPCDCGGAPPAPEGICVTDARDCYDNSECPGDQICVFDVEGDGGSGSDPAEAPEPVPCECDEDGDCDCGDEDAFVAQPGVCVDPPRFECFDDADCPRDMECSFDGDGFRPDDGDCACPECEEGEDCPPCDCDEPAPRPDGVCVPRDDVPDCNDNSDVFCDAEPPVCEPGTEVFARDGCWVCLDPETCEEPSNECFGAWVDERGTCRGANDGVINQECCEMPPPPLPFFEGGLMHNNCAPHDAPAITFVLTPAPTMACEMDLGAQVRITTWDLERLFGEMFISLSDDSFAGHAEYCPGGGSACSSIGEGEIFFEFIERGEFAVGGGYLIIEGQPTEVFFDIPHCEGFDVEGCG